MRFQDKVALVTGAGSGIGKATALLLAGEGARVGALGHKEDELAKTVADIERQGGKATALPADVSRPEQMQAAVDGLISTWHRLDIVIANAGINGVWAPIDDLKVEEWDKTMDVNLKGTFLTFKYTVPHLRKGGGCAVITSSGQGTRNFSVPGSTAYACSKAAQVTLAKKMALELAQDNVRVNVICPGSTDTRINDTVVKRNLDRIALPVAFPRGKVLLTGGKPARPEDVAKLIVFLASDDASMITGSEVWIDGAMSLIMG